MMGDAPIISPPYLLFPRRPAMQENEKPYCPDCDDGINDGIEYWLLDRRDFVRTAATVALAGAVPALAHADDAPKTDKTEKSERPAETLTKELYSTLSAEQKKELVLPWDHGSERGAIPTRLGMYNSPIMRKTVGGSYTKAQQDLV